MKNWKVWVAVLIVVSTLIVGTMLGVYIFIPQYGDDSAAGL